MEGPMANSSTQGWGLLYLLVAFTLLSISLFFGGSIVPLLLGVVMMAVSIVTFRKAKPLENQS
jgi:hypothetical protein